MIRTAPPTEHPIPSTASAAPAEPIMDALVAPASRFVPEHRRGMSTAPRPSRANLLLALAACLALWLAVRAAFFQGFAGSDDLRYVRYAICWDRAPINHWEARLISNALTRGAILTFGFSEWTATLPSLLASLTMLVVTFLWAQRRLGLAAATCAGLLLATLPIDADGANFPSAHVIMTALVVLGSLAFVESADVGWRRWLAGGLLATGAVTHLAGIYYVAAVCGAGLLLAPRKYFASVVIVAICGVLAFAADMAVFQLAFGDALLRFRLALGQSSSVDEIAPLFVSGKLNAAFFLVPLQNLVYSKAFGVALGAAMLVGLLRWRKLDISLRILLAAAILNWLWMSYGSQAPWTYKPFWRLMRFFHPLALASVLVLGAALATIRPRWRVACITPLIALGLLNLLASGPWGQNARISAGLLPYVRAHADQTFAADLHTLNELYVLNGCAHLPNVVALDGYDHGHLLDPAITQHPSTDAIRFDALLDNPLNTRRDTAFAAFLKRNAGPGTFATPPAYRPLCTLIPPLKSLDWSLRRPSGHIRECQPQHETLLNIAAAAP